MNPYKPAHKAKVRHLCFFLILCLHLAWGGVPGPCKHSVTKDHLLNLTRLLDNQLQNGCSITYGFTERQSLSEVCYVKAAFPQIQDLLNTHFQYAQSSDNNRYVVALKTFIFNIYSQKCIPEINEELEDNPVKFMKIYNTSPREGLEKTQEVIQMYMSLMTERNSPVDWNCEDEYAEDYPESTTALPPTSGARECHCSCPISGLAASEVSMLTTIQWNGHPKPTVSQPTSAIPPRMSASTVGITRDKSWPSKKTGHREVQGAVSKGPLVRGQGGKTIPENISPSIPTGTDPTPEATSVSDLSSIEHNDSTHENDPYTIFASVPDSTEDTFFSTEKESTQSTDVLTDSLSVTGSHSELQSRTVPVSQLAIPIPFQIGPSGITPNSPDQSTALVLAKRSVDVRVHGVPSDADAHLLQNGIAATIPEPNGFGAVLESLGPTLQADKKIIRIATTMMPSLKMIPAFSKQQPAHFSTPTNSVTHSPTPKSVPKYVTKTTKEALVSTDPRQQPADEEMEDASASDQPAAIADKSFHNGEAGDTSISYAFIIASVCGGLLLITALFCYKEQRKCHRSKVTERHRLNTHSTDIELQYCEANA